MIEVIVNAKSIEATLVQMQNFLGGEISERWGEHTLSFDNDVGKGCIRCITFEWGVSLVEIDALFFDDILLYYNVVASSARDWSCVL